jgi:hypothetical protein
VKKNLPHHSDLCMLALASDEPAGPLGVLTCFVLGGYTVCHRLACAAAVGVLIAFCKTQSDEHLNPA